MTDRVEAFEDALWASEEERAAERALGREQEQAWAREQEEAYYADLERERREDEERQHDPFDKTSEFYYTDAALQMRRDSGLEG